MVASRVRISFGIRTATSRNADYEEPWRIDVVRLIAKSHVRRSVANVKPPRLKSVLNENVFAFRRRSRVFRSNGPNGVGGHKRGEKNRLKFEYQWNDASKSLTFGAGPFTRGKENLVAVKRSQTSSRRDAIFFRNGVQKKKIRRPKRTIISRRCRHPTAGHDFRLLEKSIIIARYYCRNPSFYSAVY